VDRNLVFACNIDYAHLQVILNWFYLNICWFLFFFLLYWSIMFHKNLNHIFSVLFSFTFCQTSDYWSIHACPES
jgi:hypothetical protein